MVETSASADVIHVDELARAGDCLAVVATMRASGTDSASLVNRRDGRSENGIRTRIVSAECTRHKAVTAVG